MQVGRVANLIAVVKVLGKDCSIIRFIIREIKAKKMPVKAFGRNV
jgi:hypothetical protein